MPGTLGQQTAGGDPGTAIEEISLHLQIFVLNAAVDPDNLGEIKIQTSAPNPHISVLLQNFCAKKMAAFTAHSQEYQSRQKKPDGQKKIQSYVD